MFAFTNRSITRLLSLAIAVDVEPAHSTKGELHWRAADIRDAESDIQRILARLSRFWSKILESYIDELRVEILHGLTNGKGMRVLRLDATYAPPTNMIDAFDTKCEDYGRVLLELTTDLFTVISAYNNAFTATGKDISIKLGDPHSTEENVIHTKHQVVLDAAVLWLLDDARRGSTRKQLQAQLSNGDPILIPAAPGTYPKSKSDELLTYVGVFDAPNDDRRVTIFRLKRGRKTLILQVPPELRDAVINTQLDRTRVRVTIKKRYLVIAGASSFEDYELIHFEPDNDGLFSAKSRKLVKAPRLVMINDRRRQSEQNEQFSGDNRRKSH